MATATSPRSIGAPWWPRLPELSGPPARRTASSNPGSNADPRARTHPNDLEHFCPDHPKDWTVSDHLDTDRARLLIRRFGQHYAAKSAAKPSDGSGRRRATMAATNSPRVVRPVVRRQLVNGRSAVRIRSLAPGGCRTSNGRAWPPGGRRVQTGRTEVRECRGTSWVGGLWGTYGTPRTRGPASGETRQLFVTFCLVAWDRGGTGVHGYGER
jgi:hypothetical protein